MMLHKLIISLTLLLLLAGESFGQEIEFSKYAEYNMAIGELDNGDLEFGQIVSGSGPYTLDINNGKIITVTGVEYLDIIVEVDADNYLYLNGVAESSNDDQRIPFTLKAAYANNPGTPNIGRAKEITDISGNSFIKYLSLLERQHQPPGPPPAPPTNATDFAALEETAYLYLYGMINVGEVDAGPYSGEVTVTINYQ